MCHSCVGAAFLIVSENVEELILNAVAVNFVTQARSERVLRAQRARTASVQEARLPYLTFPYLPLGSARSTALGARGFCPRGEGGRRGPRVRRTRRVAARLRMGERHTG